MTFKITFPMELRQDKYYDPEATELDFDSKLINTQWDFSERYSDSPWTILLGDKVYYFDVGDLSYIWMELPELLRHCIEAQQDMVNFYFASQHTDTALLVEPSSDGNLLISIVRDYAGRRAKGATFNDLGLQRIGVSTHQFLVEWYILVDTMIRILIEHQLITSDDSSIEDYLARMPKDI